MARTAAEWARWILDTLDDAEPDPSLFDGPDYADIWEEWQ